MKTVGRWMLIGTFPVFAGLSTSAQTRPVPRYPLNAEAIVNALHADGLDVQAAQVKMPMFVNAAVASPALELFGADRMPDGHVRMRLRCRVAGECVAFSVTIDRARTKAPYVADAVAAATTPRRTPPEQVAKLSIPSATATPVATVPTALTAVTPPALSPVAAAPASFGVGAKLTLVMEDGSMHIHLPVIAIDSSAAGTEVRVCTTDRKHTFRATVVDSTTVRGIVE